MKPYSSSYESANKLRKDKLNCANGSQLSIHLLMLVDDKDSALGIADYARTSSIYAGVPLSTICMSWPVLSRFKLIFKMLLDFSTGSLDEAD
jgi:hypothetical protein